MFENLDLKKLLNRSKNVGCPGCHPKTMMKIVIYAYLLDTYFSRKMKDFTANDIRFMWLSGMQHPDHNTINTFHSSKLKGILKEVFDQIVHLVNSNPLSIPRFQPKMVLLPITAFTKLLQTQPPMSSTSILSSSCTDIILKESIADAGYGSEENDITSFIKYNYFHKEQTKKNGKMGLLCTSHNLTKYTVNTTK